MSNAHNTAKIIIVDDDELFRESLTGNLTDAGFEVQEFDGGPPMLEALETGIDGELVLLDWKMPGMTGIEVLRALRDKGCDLPVIFLTVLSEQIYEEAALIGGAVDFIEKSRSFAILKKRIELNLARPQGGGETTENDAAALQDTGPLRLEPGRHRAYWKETEVPLTISEFRMIELLATGGGNDVSYRELYDAVRGEGFVAGQGDEGHRQNVRKFINRIRDKFKALDPDFDSIENYHGFGYRWRHNAG